MIEVMRSTTPHIGAEPSVGPKTVVVGFPRVVVECLTCIIEGIDSYPYSI